ncbi:DUF4411 family protein [Corynebacterium cystitidis]|uniref:DUF4411 family protein n=1 Tax=Corynebacterium cystitidis TaxID=35757 RepID=UPI00211E049F|nr:DUF4411 family protein [Corynebacterium cystitidis]
MYLLDTNIIFDAFNNYPREVFPSYWQKFEEFIHNQAFYFHETVKDEIYRREDEAAAWFRESVPDSSVLFKDDAEITSYAEVTQWVRHGRQPAYEVPAVRQFLGVADSWIIASAHARGYTIISNEKRNPRKITAVKLPDVADAFEIPYFTGLEFFRHQGITF